MPLVKRRDTAAETERRASARGCGTNPFPGLHGYTIATATF